MKHVTVIVARLSGLSGRVIIAVHFVRVEYLLGDNFHLAAWSDLAIKARTITFMTGSSMLDDLDEQRIGVAIDVNSLDFLNVPGALSLHPQFTPASRPEMGLAGFKGFLERLGIHVRHHQDLLVFGIYYDSRYQSVRIVFQGTYRCFQTHCGTFS